jgi:hypothetical protein
MKTVKESATTPPAERRYGGMKESDTQQRADQDRWTNRICQTIIQKRNYISA